MSNVTPVTASNTSDIFLRKRKHVGSQEPGKRRLGRRHYYYYYYYCYYYYYYY